MKRQNIIIIFTILLISFVIISVIYSAKTSSCQRPDEFGHFSYIKYLQKFDSMPHYTSPYSFWEAHQPPLYYILSQIPLIFYSSYSIETQLISIRIFNIIFAIFNILLLYRLFIMIGKKIQFSETKQQLFALIGTIIAAFWPMYLYIASGVNNDNLANMLGTLTILLLLKLPNLFSETKKMNLSGYYLLP